MNANCKYVAIFIVITPFVVHVLHYSNVFVDVEGPPEVSATRPQLDPHQLYVCSAGGPVLWCAVADMDAKSADTEAKIYASAYLWFPHCSSQMDSAK